MGVDGAIRAQQEDYDRLDEIMDTHVPKPKSILEGKNILQQEVLLDNVAVDVVDLTKRGNYGNIDFDFDALSNPW